MSDDDMPLNPPFRRYQRAGVCIYCGRGEAEGVRLTNEHVIPLSFGGRLILPDASCPKCQTVIGKAEDHCFKGMIETARDHMGLRGRQKIKSKTRLPVRFTDGTGMSVPRDDHPSALIMPWMAKPRVMLGLPPAECDDPTVRVALKPMTGDLGERTRRIGRPDINLTRGLSALTFHRMIAKIAHAFAVAELGVSGFKPCLVNLILDTPPRFADSYVGSGAIIEAPGTALHEIDFGEPIQAGNSELLVVRLRLFAHIEGFPTHFAVVGTRVDTQCPVGIGDSH